MMHNAIFEREPLAFVQGDTVKWRRSDLGAKYPASTGVKLIYHFVPVHGTITDGTDGNKISIECTRDGDDFVATIDMATSRKFALGANQWQAFIQPDPMTERSLADFGTTNVQEDLTQVAAGARDNRTMARKALDNVNAVLANNASADQKSYQIDGRRLDRIGREELLKLRSKLQREVNAENDANRLRGGRKDGHVIRTRFG